MTIRGEPPMPLEWHPWYRDKTWLLDWLNGATGYPASHVKIPVVPPLRVAYSVNPEDSATLNTVTLTKHRAQGWAPYVGRPFVYAWTVAVDELGRGIANDSERVYVEDFIRGF